MARDQRDDATLSHLHASHLFGSALTSPTVRLEVLWSHDAIKEMMPA